MKKPILLLAGAILACVVLLGAVLSLPFVLPGAALGRELSQEEFAARYEVPLAPPVGPVAVYHLGHSLTGRDMPAILAGFAGHDWNSQLGWGASLNAHRKGEVAGMAEENATTAFRPAGEAIASGEYPVVVLTEMVALEDAIRWHDAPGALGFWVAEVRKARPDARVYLYETWHSLNDTSNDPGDWLGRIGQDLPALWEGALLRPAMAAEGTGTIHVIPGGQVMAAAVRAAEAGELPGLRGVEDFLSDDIHFNDTGAWLMAVAHYAVIYGRSPVGLPVAVSRADGSRINIDPVAARRMQEIAWDVVTAYPPSGVVQRREP
ncbi:hypothetical protein M3484_19325 [Pseudomonas sp. GX19020]|uniref:hypothetical protein n=1 Tax=Pseudomonas sp. GX19020 TaxID=2942277 RepID=UPI002019AAB4|nr:hypothetical protein [Pseudomonas sp. GX19020]MCL4068722.1 hypothetical protein [Pseudomonas sp. GX19020]